MGLFQSCSRKIHFCYGHRVMNHESKCATLHGHNGIVWVKATPVQGLDSIGRIIDFSVLKEELGEWIDRNWDHTTILWKKDTQTIELLKKAPKFKDLYLLDENPTAENLAKYLLWEVCPKLFQGKNIIVYKIIFWETENCYAEQSVDIKDSEIRKRYQIDL